jgi:hypothetical protein
MIAATGSPLGTRGIATTPAPRRPRVLVDLDDPLRAVRADRADCAVESLRAVAAGSCAPAAGAVPQTSQ